MIFETSLFLNTIHSHDGWRKDNAVIQLVEAVANGALPKCSGIGLTGNSIGDEGGVRIARALTAAFKSRTVIYLDQSGIESSTRGQFRFDESRPSLVIYLDECGIGSSGGQALEDAQAQTGIRIEWRSEL